MSTETSPADQAAAKLRRMADEGGTIGSALLQAIATLRKAQFPNEAENLENALLELPTLVERHQEKHQAASGSERSGLQRTIAPHTIPEHLRDGIETYIEKGRETGGFLMALLENDLRRAIGSADPTSLAGLPALVRYLNTHAPSIAWGSVANVQAWMALPQADRDAAVKAAMVF